MATRVLTMSARLGPVPQPPATQDEPVFAQLKPVLGAANPARDAALFPGDDLKHAHHHPPAQPAPPPAAGPRLPSEELVQVSRAAGRPASLPGLGRVPPLRGAGDRGRSRLGRAGAGARVGSPALRSQTGRRGVDGGVGRGPTRSAERCSRAPCLFFLRGNGSLCPHSI